MERQDGLSDGKQTNAATRFCVYFLVSWRGPNLTIRVLGAKYVSRHNEHVELLIQEQWNPVKMLRLGSIQWKYVLYIRCFEPHLFQTMSSLNGSFIKICT